MDIDMDDLMNSLKDKEDDYDQLKAMLDAQNKKNLWKSRRKLSSSSDDDDKGIKSFKNLPKGKGLKGLLESKTTKNLGSKLGGLVSKMKLMNTVGKGFLGRDRFRLEDHPNAQKTKVLFDKLKETQNNNFPKKKVLAKVSCIKLINAIYEMYE